MKFLTHCFCIFVFFLSTLSQKAQCTFGNFPPSYTKTVNMAADNFIGSRYYLANPMYLTGLGFKGENTGAKIQMALYKDNNYAVGNFVAITNTAVVGSGNIILNVLTPTTIPAGYYYIMCNTDIIGFHIAASDASSALTSGTPVNFGLAPPTNTLLWGSVGLNYDRNVWAVSEVALPTSTSICTGQGFTLQAAGAASYSWSTGANTPSIAVNPSVTSMYTLTTSGTSTCNTTVVTVSVYPYPVVTMSASSTTVCLGTPITFTAYGASNYRYNHNGAITDTTSIYPYPYYSQTYSVVGTTNGCSATTTLAVTVNTVPTIIMIGNAFACRGSTTSLDAYGAISYSWSPMGITTYSAVFTPVSDIAYTLISTGGNGCSTINTGTVYAGPLPTLSIVSTDSICLGASEIMNAFGAFSYTWSTGQSSSSLQVSPLSTTIYTLTGEELYSGCKSSLTKTITVNALPLVVISGQNAICMGDAALLTASGASAYTWNTGTISNSLLISPLLNTSYTVTGTDQNGCVASAITSVVVNALPTLTLSGGSFVCQGAFVSQLVSGSAISYSWSNGYVGNPASLSPSVSAVYTVTGTDANSCKNSLTKLITVNPLPVILAHGSPVQICIGSSAVAYATGANSYVWSNGILDNVIFYPITSAVYTVTGTASNACQNTATLSLPVNPLPDLTMSINNTLVCKGSLIILTAGGAQKYTWSTGDTASYISFIPSVNTTYTLSGLNTVTGCTNSIVQQILVNECTGITRNSVSGKSPLVYPNPTSGEFTINLNEFSEMISVEVFNSLGELILLTTSFNSATSIDLRNKPNGIYSIVLKEGKNSHHLKVLKE